ESATVFECLRDPLTRIQIKAKARRSERKIQIHQNNVALEAACDHGSHVVGDGRGTHAPFRSDESQTATELLGPRVMVDPSASRNQGCWIEGADDVFAHAAKEELSIDCDIVRISDYNYFRAGYADFSEGVQFPIKFYDWRPAFDDDNIRRG